MDEIITLDYGSGGKKTSRLIESMIVPALANPALSELGDGAVIPGADKLVFSTDSFVVDPIFFPGGSIGKLSVCGTVNDIAMCGGEPKYLSCAFIIEEGFPAAELARVVEAIREAGEKAGVQVVTGDTKVVERGRGDKIYINTAGIGFLKYPGLSPKAIRPGDKVIVSGTVGDHGTAVMLARSGMMQGNIKSDCAPLNGLCAAILESGAVPVRGEVQAACDMLGLDPMYCANEGKLLAVVPPEDAENVLAAMRAHEFGRGAAVIGEVSAKYAGKVVMHTELGGSRIMQKLTGAQLPRIC